MTYKRKTKDEYHLEGLWEGQWGYIMAFDTYVEAQREKKCYMENDPRPYRIRKHLIPIEEGGA